MGLISKSIIKRFGRKKQTERWKVSIPGKPETAEYFPIKNHKGRDEYVKQLGKKAYWKKVRLNEASNIEE